LRDQHALPTLLSDPALDAFAQLGAFRLDVTRCLISIFDRNHQYIVAEATRNSVVAPFHQQHEEVWLGGTAIARCHGICEHVLIATDDIHEPPNAELPVSIVPDLAEDSRFCNRPYIHGPPCNRFYAGVPLRAGNVNIGVLCVFDENPRAGLESVQIECLRGLSRIIMGYLEFKESATGFRKSERSK
jgi:GAF domain-containing protein